ncbi:MAG: lamin tail domain-containing protein [Planctomycetota bacterium]
MSMMLGCDGADDLNKTDAPKMPVGQGGQGFTPLETLEPRLLFTAVPLITEFLASNDNDLVDEDGDDSDWLELFNAGDTALDLAGWHLTDDATDLTKWTLPSVSLDAGRYLVVFASGKDRADADGTELHTNFSLSAGGEYLALVEPNGTTIAYEYAPDYPAQEQDVSYGLEMVTTQEVLVAEGSNARYIVPTAEIIDWQTVGFDDTLWAVAPTGLGYENSPGDNVNFTSRIETVLPDGTTSVYLRQSFNVTDPALFDTLVLGLRYDDGFVAYLNGVVVEAQNEPEFPAFDSTATASHSDPQAIDFVPFDITDHLDLLVAGNNVLAIHGLNTNNSSDYLIEAELIASGSQVVQPHERGYFDITTPGGPNGEAFDGFVADTVFSVERGIYDTPFSVALSTATAGATIVYTLDGSEPAVDEFGVITNGTAYTAPLNVTTTTTLRAAGFMTGLKTPRIATHTYLFPADVINQTDASVIAQGLPATWGPFSPDYAVNVAPGNEAAFTAALTAIPTISITIDNDELFDPATGIYTNSTERGSEWERAASIELINPDGSVGFQEDAGLRMQGGAFRNNSFTRKNSFRIAFRDEYGAGRLHYPLFGEDAAQSFNTITLRMDSNDGYAWTSAGAKPQYARDEWGRQTQLAMGQPSSHGMRAHLYLNGVYWGLYNPVERPDANFAADYYGGDDEDWDVLNRGGATDGNFQAWDAFLLLAQAVADAPDEASRNAIYQQILGNNPDGTHNAAFENYLDAENYIDYLLVNFFGGNSDWPNNNYFMARERGADSTGFKFHIWDFEWTLRIQANTNDDRTDVDDGVAEPYADLRASEEFRMLFADRAHRALFNGGALAEANAIARYQAILDELTPAFEGEVARWGDQHNPAGYTFADWQTDSGKVINQFLTGRAALLVSHLQGAGLYSTVEAVSWNQRGGMIGATTGIELTAPAGTIYYTLDGSDPRAIGGGLSANAIEYTGPILPGTNVKIRARVLDTGVWSAIDQADFVIADAIADASNLRITELQYNPVGPNAAETLAGFTDGDQFEFIELMNTSTTDIIDLSGVRFTAGVTFEFEAGTTLAPGERITLVSDTAAFTQRYGPNSSVVGEFDGKLSNGGEQITLVDTNDVTILDFTYDDDPLLLWPTAPDGNGESLVVLDTEGDYNSPANWAASVSAKGSPGAAEPLAGDVNLDGFVGAADLDQVLATWGLAVEASAQASQADLSHDGFVGSADVAIVIANFGNGTPPSQPTSNGETPDDPDPGDGGADNDGNGEGDNPDTPNAGNTPPPNRPARGAPVPPRRPAANGSNAANPPASRGPAITPTRTPRETLPPAAPAQAPAPSATPMPAVTPAPATTQSPAPVPVPARRADAPTLTATQQRAAHNATRANALALAKPTEPAAEPPADDAPAQKPRRFDALNLR